MIAPPVDPTRQATPRGSRWGLKSDAQQSSSNQPFKGFTNTMTQADLSARNSTPSGLGCFFKGCGAIVALMMLLALLPAWLYGVNSHHESRSSIWPPRGQSLIPPTATDITLHRDLLDHYATYTVSEKDLNAFLNERFAQDGEVLDSYAERGRPGPAMIGKAIGQLGFVVTAETVTYDFWTSNGAGSSYYHDPTTGLTYQDSAYW